METFADEFGLTLGDVSWNSLRSRIEQLAALAVHMLAERIASKTIGQVEELFAQNYRRDASVQTETGQGQE